MRGAFTIDDVDAGLRVDVFITRHAEGISRSRVSAAIRDGAVLVNGDPTKPSRPLDLGDVVEFEVNEAVAIDARAQNIPLNIVFEDETLLVVNKPAGMVTHPAHGTTDGTLVNALLGHVAELPGETVRAGLVHRLDRDTSGLLVVAKTPEALATLGRAMQARYIKREYLGIVAGIPRDPEGTISGAIGRDARNRLRYAIRADGKPAVTHYAVREELTQAAECIFRLETGRTHQIRVHLAALGHPLLCDPLYGRPDARLPLPGQALHAWRLGFKHPKTKEMLQFEVDPPREYLVTLAMLRA